MFSKIHDHLDKSDAKFVSDLSTPEERLRKRRKLQNQRILFIVVGVIQYLLFLFIAFNSSFNLALLAFILLLLLIQYVQYTNLDLQIKMLLLYEKTISK